MMADPDWVLTKVVLTLADPDGVLMSDPGSLRAEARAVVASCRDVVVVLEVADGTAGLGGGEAGLPEAGGGEAEGWRGVLLLPEVARPRGWRSAVAG